MHNCDSLSIALWTSKSKKLLENVHALLNSIGFDDSGLPQDIYEEDK